MVCPLCGSRKARRDCPALHRSICSICCGTKRLTEIQCPSTCVHLAAAREHPPAAVRRQQERDAEMLLPTIRHLYERQQQCFLMFAAVVAAHRPDELGLLRFGDADVADAAGTVAATLETTARGIIYEHTAASPAAQGLARELQVAFEQGQTYSRIREGDAAPALRAIEEGARRAAADNSASTAYLELVRRITQAGRAAAEQQPAVEGPSLIVPGT